MPNDALCAAAPAFTSMVTVNGNGAYRSGSFTPVSPGTYNWVAFYGGDANNNSASSPCGAPNESAKVTCTTVISGSHTGSVIVTSGSLCIENSQFDGSVVAQKGTTLVIENSTVSGPVTGNSPESVRICGSTIGGTVAVYQATGLVVIGDPIDDGCAPNTVNGSVVVQNNLSGVDVINNHLEGSVTSSGNAAPVEISGNSDPF